MTPLTSGDDPGRVRAVVLIAQSGTRCPGCLKCFWQAKAAAVESHDGASFQSRRSAAVCWRRTALRGTLRERVVT
jgi:hypothetical protein